VSRPARPIPANVAQLLHYDPKTGLLTWKVDYRRNRHKARAGDTAGTLHDTGYLRVLGLQAHRIAWAIAYGDPGDMQIDHRNGQKSDNRLCNLRLADRAENSTNRRVHKNNTSGFTGVTWCNRLESWTAHIQVRNRRVYLGSFHAIEDAAAAYRKAAELHHGEFAAHRRAS